jgi:hypothetical protein
MEYFAALVVILVALFVMVVRPILRTTPFYNTCPRCGGSTTHRCGMVCVEICERCER